MSKNSPAPANSPVTPEDGDEDWLSSIMDSFAENTESTLTFAATSLRSSCAEAADLVSSSISESEFYRNNLAYKPPSPLHNNREPRGSSLASEDTLNELDQELLTSFDEPIDKRVASCGKSRCIGFLSLHVGQARGVFVDGVVQAGTTHPYSRVVLGPLQTWTSPVGREFASTPGSFVFDRPVSLVVHDISTDLSVQLFQKNVLVEDHCIGQVLVPLSSLVPSMTEVAAMRRQGRAFQPTYSLNSWFEIFPALKPGQKKYSPASADIAKTGMTKQKLGYIYLEIELHLFSEFSVWAGYAHEPVERLIDAPTTPMPSGDITALQSVSDSGRGFKRNFARVKISFARLFSRGPHAWPLVRFLRRARTFEEPLVSALVLLSVTFGCLLSPSYLLPINLYLVLLVGTLLGRSENEQRDPETYVVWNQDIRDPDDELGSLQKVAKVVFLLGKFERWMGIAADAMERIVHIFAFADERVTVAALLVGAAAALMATTVLFFVPFGYLSYAAFLLWFFVSSDDDKPRKRKKRATFSSEEEAVASPQGRLARLRSWGSMALRAPRLAKNVFKRVPTRDELGHRWIANLQRLVGEPPEEEEPANAGEVIPDAQSDLWFREM